MVKTKSTKILKYEVVFEEAEEGGYTVSCPTLPGCISEGDSFEEAKENITEAISAYIESLAEDNTRIISQEKNFLSLKGFIEGEKNWEDKNFDKKVSKFIAKDYAETIPVLEMLVST